MQTHTTPRAHVCTTLPPGDLPLRSSWPDLHGSMYLKSGCGRLHRYCNPITGHSVFGPIGSWYCNEVRTDDTGQRWIKAGDSYFVNDDFGNLVPVPSQRGAA